MSIASEIVELVKLIAEMARAGLTNEEIEERLNDPDSVGADLLKKADERAQHGKSFLGRRPK